MTNQINLLSILRSPKDTQTPGARSRGRLNVNGWRLMFVASHYETSLSHHSGTKNFEVAARILENLCTPENTMPNLHHTSSCLTLP